MPANSNKLLHANEPFQDSIVFNFNMAGKVYIIGKDDVIPQNAIVRYMRVRHQQIMRSHGSASGSDSTAIDCDKLPNCGIIANFSGCNFTIELEVLRNGGNDRARKDAAMATDPRAVKKRDVRANPGIITNLHIAIYVGERPYDDVVADFGLRVYKGVSSS
jgi:CMP-2-keto-3-deoxyoctulosonic acid synthetase